MKCHGCGARVGTPWAAGEPHDPECTETEEDSDVLRPAEALFDDYDCKHEECTDCDCGQCTICLEEI